jgi:tetratricopeptide (TPR) repeat protein
MGLVLMKLGDAEAARDRQEERLRIARDIGDRRGESYALNDLGQVLASRAHWAQAIPLHEQALVIAEEEGDAIGIIDALDCLAAAHLASGRATLSLELQGRQLDASRRAAFPRGVRRAMFGQAQAYAVLGNIDLAIERARSAAQSSSDGDDPLLRRIEKALRNWITQEGFILTK